MTAYAVKFTKNALKELKKLPKLAQDKILDSLEVLAVNPYAEVLNFKKLRGNQKLFRIRVGDYRIIYEIHGHELVIIVVRIGHRKDVYNYLKS